MAAQLLKLWENKILANYVSGRTSNSTTKSSLSSWHLPLATSQEIVGQAIVKGEEVEAVFEVVEGVEAEMVMQQELGERMLSIRHGSKSNLETCLKMTWRVRQMGQKGLGWFLNL